MNCISSIRDSVRKNTSSVLKEGANSNFDRNLPFLSLPLINQYTVVSGINTGYGFFAPNVSSSYIIRFEVRDSQDNEARALLPPLKTKEGLIRYHSLISHFQNRLLLLEKEKRLPKEIKDTSLHTKYLDVVMKSIGRSIKSRAQLDPSIEMYSTLFLYDYPTLRESSIFKSHSSLVALLSLKVNMPTATKNAHK